MRNIRLRYYESSASLLKAGEWVKVVSGQHNMGEGPYEVHEVRLDHCLLFTGKDFVWYGNKCLERTPPPWEAAQ